MRRTLIYITFILSGLIPSASIAGAQTDVALSAFGAFSGTTSGNGVVQSPANQAGGMIELRHISNPLVGYEATYSFYRANQEYSQTVSPPCPTSEPDCELVQSADISNNAHEVTGDWVVSLKIAHIKPFALAGGGVLVNAPTGGTETGCFLFNPLCGRTNAPTSTSIKGVFVYGAGLDWGLVPHIGLRLQYRGNVYNAAALTSAIRSSGAFTQTSEPMIGAYLRF
jgi:opacity protein-like surface antigen